MHLLNRTVATIVFTLLAITVSAQVSELPDPLFQDQEIIDVRIVAPLTTLVRERPTEDDLLIAIPYDFDQSGLVDAPYAVPNENLRIRHVRQRLYRGRCVNNQYIADSIGKFRDNRDAIYALIGAQEGLDSKVRKNVVRYVDDFYEIIDEPRDVERQIIDRCI